jgi:CheY-like chemotaxis protein
MQEAKQRILIVENDDDTLLLIEKALQNEGYIVETCNAASGIVEFRHAVPDLFILDKDIPTIDGLAVSKFLRLQTGTREVPIIMISGYDMKSKAKRAGVNEFIRKPFRLDHLLERIKKYLCPLNTMQTV